MTQRLRTGVLAAYGAPAVAFAILLLPPYVFLPGFYAQTLGLPLDWIGYIIILSRLFDAFTDPVIGYLSDRTPGRFGRRKPWILAGTPLAILAVVVLFAPGDEASLGQFTFGIFTLTLAWTMLLLPYSAWGAELSGDYDERTRITGFREGVGLVGTLLAAATPSVLTAAGYNDPRIHMAALAVLVAALILPTVAWLLIKVPEPPPLTHARVPLRDGLKAIAENAPFRRLIAAYLINAFANGLPATLFLLFVSHVIGATDAYGPLLLAYFLAGLVGVPIWSLVARRLGKHRTWVVAMVVACVAFAFTPFVVGEGDIVPFLIISIISGIGFGADLVLPSAIQADVVDVDTRMSGEQRTGLFFALWGIATKLSFALAAAALPVLHAVGFDATALDAAGKSMNAPEALFVLTLLYAAVPVALKVIAMALMWNFPLDAQRQRAIRAEIEAA
ncbi:MAG: MFS transporter [Alphaproteobacteria bacterium]|nr:MFS transporter [Alphaproteobacteria bacterium]